MNRAGRSSPPFVTLMEYILIRSKRRTISAQVSDEGVVVRAPLRVPKREIDAFVRAHEQWIERQCAKREQQKAEAAAVQPLTALELESLYQLAGELLPERAGYYAGLLGESFGRVTIRCQSTRWGSCSAKRNLNFNCLLMLAPPVVIDAVAAHEVCHLREMNHSPRFYELLLSVCPDYREADKWLKENGRLLLARAPRK